MTPLDRLKLLTVIDFRSIKGTVHVPLDANVVLIHGPNGTGKSSLFAAIELALTGRLPLAFRTEGADSRHLIHYEATASNASVEVVRDGSASEYRFSLGSTPLAGAHLPPPEARFFSERVHLGQSSLSRLLDLYGEEPEGDSPLTQFVKELLSLDRFDALIDGLHPAGDKRRVRHILPEYVDAENRLENTAATLFEMDASILDAEARARDLRASLAESLERLGAPPHLTQASADQARESWLASSPESDRLQTLNSYRRDIQGLLKRLDEATRHAQTQSITQLERMAGESRALADAWWSETGSKLEGHIEALRPLFPDLPSVATTDPQTAFDAALSRVDGEIGRGLRLLRRNEELRLLREEAKANEARADARLALIQDQLNSIANTDATERARLLSDALPHAHDDVCPVCGTDFSSSAESLSNRISRDLSELTAQAQRLQALGLALREAGTDSSRARSEVLRIDGQLTDPQSLQEITVRVGQLQGSHAGLTELRESVALGADTLRRAEEAERRAAVAKRADRLMPEAQELLSEAVAELKLSAYVERRPVREGLDSLAQAIGMEAENLMAFTSDRATALRIHRDLVQSESELAVLQRRRAGIVASRRRARASIAEAESRRMVARQIVTQAVAARMAIVRQVFNDSLNHLWRDLFVRLAPAEPYVPAFRLPESPSDKILARLETVHRAGGRGGTPGSMLSAGNLNTAALTLFMALHLSAPAQLPWLLLDDPVQSMDDLHISQFAGLLRTVAKEHGRQVLVAVHDRELFDYLTLELSPAFPDDSLITVELNRRGDGDTVVKTHFRAWEGDPVLQVA
jgi:DNA repair protein SbcC/Rad50